VVHVQECTGSEGQLDEIDKVTGTIDQVFGGAEAQSFVNDHGHTLGAGLNGAPGNGHFKVSDKNSLFDRGNIGEMGLWVKKNKSQYMGVLGYPVARRIVRDTRAGEAGLRGG